MNKNGSIRFKLNLILYNNLVGIGVVLFYQVDHYKIIATEFGG